MIKYKKLNSEDFEFFLSNYKYPNSAQNKRTQTKKNLNRIHYVRILKHDLDPIPTYMKI